MRNVYTVQIKHFQIGWHNCEDANLITVSQSRSGVGLEILQRLIT